ncbi:bifunctional aminoglycoside phosphotransferase/ATP-binding protein [Mycobacterium sp.]|uniref:bifunctional aminoglycoside phosphotransferase/ATP-binding protein n=1 Tax=Mycobacterium sp. TaxID=1785 RepID=UPI0025E634D9|nr:bifunctional aminoglycoside phosphotransferase/ATP-binding protein [Mycobacterium sp.]
MAYLDIHETHTGVVVLAGDRAYKAKKPLRTGFLDFRAPEQRERACCREVELNSRLSPESYFGVAYLSDPAGGPDEPVIVMRRYRDDDRLAAMVRRGPDESVRDALDAVADVLARFHRDAERSQAINLQGDVEAIECRWRDNLSELREYAPSTPGLDAESVSRIEHLVAEFVGGRGSLFTRRIDERCIVDGHGDLLADDIFWVAGKPALLDCLEFDDALRYVDCIDDAAFLTMDLEFLGRKDFADYFGDRYAEHSGHLAPVTLRDFYIAYRATVRAKVDCVRFSQGNSEAADDAASHLAIAVEHLQNGAVRLALVGGNPGTGKSTVARGIAETFDAQVISTDDIRRELRDSGVISGGSGVLDSGLYCPDNVAAVYEAVLHRARLLLGNGRSVILDGTWRDPEMRARASRLAGQTHSAMVELMCSTSGDVAADRIVTRRPGNSEVTPEIAEALAARHSGWQTAHVIDTSTDPAQVLREAGEVWRRAS